MLLCPWPVYRLRGRGHAVWHSISSHRNMWHLGHIISYREENRTDTQWEKQTAAATLHLTVIRSQQRGRKLAQSTAGVDQPQSHSRATSQSSPEGILQFIIICDWIVSRWVGLWGKLEHFSVYAVTHYIVALFFLHKLDVLENVTLHRLNL